MNPTGLPFYPLTNAGVNDAIKINADLLYLATHGLTGPAGPTGAFGGPPGPKGATGIRGVQGITGLANYTIGPAFPAVLSVPHFHYHTNDDIWYTYESIAGAWIDISSGDMGFTGPWGASGIGGVTGVHGFSGIQGSQGNTGAQGNGITGIINFSVNYYDVTVPTGIVGEFRMPFAFALDGWYLTATPTGSVFMDILKTNYTLYPVATAMNLGVTGPNIALGVKNNAVTSTWGYTGSENDIVQIKVLGATGTTKFNLSMRYHKI